MAKDKIKSLALTKQKVAEVDGEHHITFVASTENEDRDFEHVAISTFRLPMKGGGHIVVQDIPAEGIDNVDVPFLTDHDLFSVEKTIGSVRKAYFVDGALIFDAGISSRPYAQEMFKLVEEGHLDNAFSIQYRDYQRDPANDTDYNGEIVEVSLVTRGSNMDAQVLATKSLEGKKAVDEKEAEAPKTEEVVEEVQAEVEAEAEPVAEPVEKSTEEVAEPKAEEEAKEEPEAEPEAEEAEENIKEEKEQEEMTTPTEVAKTLVKEPSQDLSEKAPAEDYLKSKAAVKDFAKTIAENGTNAMKVWQANLSAKGLTGDAILPAEIEEIFFKAWVDNPSVLATFGNARLNSGAVYGMATESRALGHKKGEAKANQDVEVIRRDIKSKIIYKKLPLDLQDLIDDTTGELLRFRVRELADRVANEIVVSAILGDGRSSGTPDYRTFDGTRGLWSMAADIANSTDGTTYPFAAAVATQISNDAGDTAYDKLVKTISAVDGENKVAVVAKGFVADLLLTKNAQGQYIFTPGTNLEQLLGIRIIELPEMTGAAFDVIAYAEGQYVLFGNQEFVRSRFDDTYNQDVMLVERAVAGSLTGRKSAAGYLAAES